jgi:hypothetical protein
MSGEQAHPYCAITVVCVPLDEDGKPQTTHTVTFTGVGATLAEPEEVLIRWRPDRETGVWFTIAGSVDQI